MTPTANAGLRSARAAGVVVLAALLLVQPLVIFVSSYHPRDCDDKAVHLFSALYAWSPADARERFHDMLAPFVRSHEHDPRWSRTTFRLTYTASYPLANLAIRLVHRPGMHFTESVKWALLAATVIALAGTAMIGASTRFGFWRTALVLNLIAFHAIPGSWLLPRPSRIMLPFLWHAPRAPAALMVIALVLAVGGRAPWRALAALALMFTLHSPLAVLCAAIAVAAGAACWLADRYDLWRRPYVYAVFALGALDGALALCALLGVLVFLCSASARQFDARACRFACLMLFSSILAAVAARSVGGSAELYDLPARLGGIQYCLLVLCTVLGASILLPLAETRLRLPTLPPMTGAWVAAAILAALAYVRAGEYERLMSGGSAFFVPTCTEARVVPLPAQLGELTLDDETTMFVSFADYFAR